MVGITTRLVMNLINGGRLRAGLLRPAAAPPPPLRGKTKQPEAGLKKNASIDWARGVMGRGHDETVNSDGV
jgi:hypothetical protein